MAMNRLIRRRDAIACSGKSSASVVCIRVGVFQTVFAVSARFVGWMDEVMR